MLWAGCKATLYLDENAASVCVDGGEVRIWQGQPWATHLPEVVAHVTSHRCKQLEIWLSGSLARPYLVPAVQGLKRWSEVEAMANSLAESATQQEGPLHVWLGRWRGDQPMLAVACPLPLMTALHDLKSSHGLRVKSIAPVWRWVAQQDTSDEHDAHMLLIHEASATTLLHKDASGQWSSVATYAPPVPEDQLHSWAVRHAFSRGVDAQQVKAARLWVQDMTVTDAHLPNRFAPPLRVSWEAAHAD